MLVSNRVELQHGSRSVEQLYIGPDILTYIFLLCVNGGKSLIKPASEFWDVTTVYSYIEKLRGIYYEILSYTKYVSYSLILLKNVQTSQTSSLD